MEIEYSLTDYETIDTLKIDEEELFKLVKFTTEYYGIISHNPKTQHETVILLSPDKDIIDKQTSEGYRFGRYGGQGCRRFMNFADITQKYYEKLPLELVVKLGENDEFREVITRDQQETLYEKMAICIEIAEARIEESITNNDYYFIVSSAFIIVVISVILMIKVMGGI